jgi:anion-transporting  ArsA/GET3 family ATPase
MLLKNEEKLNQVVVYDPELCFSEKLPSLFKIVESKEYTQEIKNNAQQYIKAKKSVPAFASALDSLDENTIKKMDNEIEDVINSFGGLVGTLFNFTLYIARKI